MINPVVPAVESWLAIFQNLPPAIMNLVYLAFGSFFVVCLILLFWRIR